VRTPGNLRLELCGAGVTHGRLARCGRSVFFLSYIPERVKCCRPGGGDGSRPLACARVQWEVSADADQNAGHLQGLVCHAALKQGRRIARKREMRSLARSAAAAWDDDQARLGLAVP